MLHHAHRWCFSFFFFSSRRRHTRSLCDWSSDVCSSDLTKNAPVKHHLSQGTAGYPETEPQYDQSRDGAYTDEPTGLPTVSCGSGRHKLRIPQLLLNTG